MNTQEQHKDVSKFGGRTETGKYFFASAFENGIWVPRAGNELKAESEERRHHITAFEANPTSAAGRRMRLYLKSIRNGSVAAALMSKSNDGGPTDMEKTRVAFIFLMVSENARMARAKMMASTALDQTGRWYDKYKDTLESLMNEAKEQYEALNAQATVARENVSAAETRLAEIELSADQTKAQLDEAGKQIGETDEKAMAANDQAVILENQAIKIVRSLRSISELKGSLTGAETEAPEIYIASGTTAGGVRLYDKITMGEDGEITVETIDANDAPAELEKEEGIAFCDTIERVYYKTDESGKDELLRMEYGINDGLLGNIGAISSDMIDQYMRATGKTARELTVAAPEYAGRIRTRNNHIDALQGIYEKKNELKDLERLIEENLNEAIEEHKRFTADLQKIEEKKHICSDRMCEIGIGLKQAELVLKQHEEYTEKLHNGTFKSAEEMIAAMPDDLKEAFTERYEIVKKANLQSENSPFETKGQSTIAAAWAIVAPAVEKIMGKERTYAYAPDFNKETAPQPA